MSCKQLLFFSVSVCNGCSSVKVFFAVRYGSFLSANAVVVATWHVEPRRYLFCVMNAPLSGRFCRVCVCNVSLKLQRDRNLALWAIRSINRHTNCIVSCAYYYFGESSLVGIKPDNSCDRIESNEWTQSFSGATQRLLASNSNQDKCNNHDSI